MTTYPAPGSDVPGAPPALRRGLGPDDGTVVRSAPTRAGVEPGTPALPAPGTAVPVGVGPYLPALGLAVAAAVVETGTWRSRRRARRRLT